MFLIPESSSGGIVVNENMNMIEEQLSNGLNGITMSDTTLAVLVLSRKPTPWLFFIYLYLLDLQHFFMSRVGEFLKVNLSAKLWVRMQHIRLRAPAFSQEESTRPWMALLIWRWELKVAEKSLKVVNFTHFIANSQLLSFCKRHQCSFVIPSQYHPFVRGTNS